MIGRAVGIIFFVFGVVYAATGRMEAAWIRQAPLDTGFLMIGTGIMFFALGSIAENLRYIWSRFRKL